MSTFEQRYSVHLWMVKHPEELEKHVNEWIAATASGIIASHKSLTTLMKNESVKKEQDKGNVVFSLIPDPSKGLVV